MGVARCVAALLCLLAMSASAAGSELRWKKLPSIPNAQGVAGAYAGVSGGAMIVGGGANFPDRMPWEGGAKAWYDELFVLDRPDGSWRVAGKLPRAMGYGASVSADRGVLCIGGADGRRHYSDCFLLEWRKRELVTHAMPPLPAECANMCAARVGDVVYVAGGSESPASTSAMRTFWALDLSATDARWKQLQPWPGPPRMLAVAAAQGGSFFLAGGVDLSAGADGKPVRTYLRDAYRYAPAQGWKRIADLPNPLAAAPSPAPPVGQSHFFIIGGDDGSLVNFEPRSEHPGFSKRVLAYHTITDTWTAMGEAPVSRVTTPTVSWEGQSILPSGEVRPGVRSPEVWSFSAEYRRASFGWLNYVTLVLYLLAMVGIGAWFVRRQRSTADYFKGGGRIPWWAAGLSIYATMLSSITYMSIPAKAFATDWTYFWANVPILLIAPVIVHVYLPFFRQLNVTSAYEYLERRFNLVTRLYGSASFILFQIGRQAIVLYLPSLALASLTDLSIHTCIIVMGALCVIYTVLGGMEAVVWTDVAQTIVLLGAAVLSLGIIISSTGGLAGLWSTAQSAGKFHTFNWTLDYRTTANAFWAILVGNMFIVLVPYTSDQAIVQRYMTTKDQPRAARAIYTNAILSVLSTAFFFAIGTALWVYYRANPGQLEPTFETDATFPIFIVKVMPAGIAGLVVAGIFAAAQSTVSGSINSVATAAVTDFYRRFRPNVADRSALMLARWLTGVVGLLATGGALVLASFPVRSLWDTYNTLVGLAGSGLAGLFLLGIATRRAGGVGAVAGILASMFVLWWVQHNTQTHFFLYAASGICTCFVVGYIVSILLPGRRKDLSGLTVFTRNL